MTFFWTYKNCKSGKHHVNYFGTQNKQNMPLVKKVVGSVSLQQKEMPYSEAHFCLLRSLFWMMKRTHIWTYQLSPI